MLKRLLGAQWLAIGFVGGVSFLLSVFIARRFGPEAFGVYAQAVTLGTLLAILIDGGFGKLLMREAARSTPALASHKGDLHGLAFGHALLVMAIMGLVAVTLPLPLHGPTLLATVAAFGLAVMGSLSLAILRGKGRLVRDAASQIVNRTLTAVAVALALWFGANAPWQILVAQAVGALLFLAFLMREAWVSPRFRVPAEVYAVVVPLIWLDLATVIYFRSDMLLFKAMGVPKADVGAYGVAFRLIEAFLLLATPVSLMLFRHFRLNGDSMRNATLWRIVRIAGMAGCVGLAIFVMSLVTADWFFTTAFGDEFALAGDLFKVLSLMLVFALANGVIGQGVFALGEDRRYVWTATAAAVFNVLGNLLVMPVYGVWGAAWMTVATEVVLGAGLVWALAMAWRRKLNEGVSA